MIGQYKYGAAKKIELTSQATNQFILWSHDHNN